MAMKYTQIPTDTFETIQLNAGIIASGFTPSTGAVTGILGATSGGAQFNDAVEYADFGDDIDNCPKNTLELKKITGRTVTLSGTFVTAKKALVNTLMAGADVDGADSTKIVPRDVLETADFKDAWWIGDYSDVNTGSSAGFIAIHLMNTLNTGGFQLQTGDQAKGQFPFELTAHYSIEDQETVPYEVYVRAGGAGNVTLNKHTATVTVGDTLKLVADTYPDGQTVTFSSDNTSEASVNSSTGVVTGVASGVVTITASMTYDGITYTDTCLVTVKSA